MISTAGEPSGFVKRSETTTTAPSLSTATPASSSASTTPGSTVVVEALARDVLVGQRHVELPVERVDVRQRDVDEVLPERDRLRVAALQRDDAAARAVRERRVGVEALLGLAIQGAQRLEVLQVRRARVEHVLGQHPELRAPVAEVVHADDAVTLELEHAHERVADHGRAQVADVHLLGHVGRGVVDGDDLRDGRGRHAEPRVLERLGRPARERFAREREVDEPGPGDLDRGQRSARRRRASRPRARPAPRGGSPSCLASFMAKFACRSNPGWRAGVTSGSTSVSPVSRSIAAPRADESSWLGAAITPMNLEQRGAQLRPPRARVRSIFTRVASSKRHVGGGEVLVQMARRARARDRDDVRRLVQQPGQRELRGRELQLGREARAAGRSGRGCGPGSRAGSAGGWRGSRRRSSPPSRRGSPRRAVTRARTRSRAPSGRAAARARGRGSTASTRPARRPAGGPRFATMATSSTSSTRFSGESAVDWMTRRPWSTPVCRTARA